MLAMIARISVGWLLCISVSSFAAAPNIAFFYGAHPPWDVLRSFDIVVVEPAYGIDPRAAAAARTQVFAYVSVGEVNVNRRYAADLPNGVVVATNDLWHSHVIDQTHPEWPQFFLDRVVAPLWTAGYRGFFLDTLDSFHLIAKTEQERSRQIDALTGLVRKLRERFPEARLIFNRGFEILPQLHRETYAVAAESLFRGWSQQSGKYVEVQAADRAWLLERLNRVRDEYALPVIAIDYAPPGERELARTTARRIAELGFVPWVTNSDLDLVGVGNIEPAPRRVLMLHDGSGRDAPLYAQRIRKQARQPFDELGYVVDYADVNEPLPASPLVGRYAGIVSWFANDQAVRKPGVREWLLRQREHGMRMAVLGNFPFPLTDALAVSFGLSVGPPRLPRGVRVEIRDPLIVYEEEANAQRTVFTPLRANQASTTLLRLRSETGETMDAAALTPWGGYVLTPYESAPLPDSGGDRWLIEPVEFMRRALALSPLTANRRADHLQRDSTSRKPLEQNASDRSSLPGAS
jgi:polysaccharide biosynthesis protein PelA